MNRMELDRLAALGVATVYEAAGRRGLLDIELTQLLPGSRAAGPARTALCGQDDNLMVHAVIERIRPGEVLVVAMPEPRPIALVGALLATQAQVRGAAAILIDGAVRDVEELRQLGLPVWTRFVRAAGANKTQVGELGVALTVGGAQIGPGDVVVLDADGGVCVPQRRAGEVLAAAEARSEREARLREQFLSGALSYDLHRLRGQVEKGDSK